MPLLALLNAGRCECLWRDLALLLFAGERFGELPEDNLSSVGVSTLSRTMGSFALSRGLGALLDRYLARLFHQDRIFFLHGLTND